MSIRTFRTMCFSQIVSIKICDSLDTSAASLRSAADKHTSNPATGQENTKSGARTEAPHAA